ncbi:hypothetical protein DYB38_002630 [Aphanomyces astaci]|uniref:Exportin-1/Importin-beta-like domain-containing protein n=1 Tax=Aphanomyces astaci TaxID=112090 RepID=A0A397DCA8_APHAT|nr:hypothetical protein DYB38_002630 [Aphanomyces astaci]
MTTKDRPHQVLAAVRRVLSADASEDDRRRADAFLQSYQKAADAIPIALMWLTQVHSHVEAHAQLFLVNAIYRAICSRGSKDMAKYQHRKEATPAISPAQLVVSCFHQLCRHIHESFSQASTPMNVANQFACCVTVCILGSTDAGVLPTLDALAGQERANTTTTNASMLYCIEMAVILVLQLVPEEIHNKRLLLRIDHRTSWESVVQTESVSVLTAVETCWRALHSHGLPKPLHDKMERAIFQAFATWVEHGRLPPAAVANSMLLSAVLEQSSQQLRNDSHHDIELLVEVIRDVTQVCVDVAHQPLVHVLLRYAIHVGPHVLQLGSHLPTDLLLQVASLLADIGQQALVCQVLDATASETSLFLDVLLAFTAHANVDVAVKTVEFWADLRAWIAINPSASAKLDPYVHQVLHVLLQSTEYARLTDHASDDFYQYRKDMRTVFRSLTQPALHYQHHFVQELTTLLFEEFARNTIGLSKLEMYLHALSAMAKIIPDSDEMFVFRILDNLACLCTSSSLDVVLKSLLRTTAVFLSVLHTWTAQHPAALPVIYVILSKCFECPEDDSICPMRVAEDHIGAVALVKMSSRCANLMASSSSELHWLHAMKAVYCANLHVAPKMTDKSLGLVLEAYAAVAAVPPDNYYDTATPAVVDLCGVMFDEMETLVPQSHDHARKSLMLVLGHLQTLVASLPPPLAPHSSRGTHPMLHVFQLNWSTLHLIFTHTQSLPIQSKVSVVFSTLFRHVGVDAASLALSVIPMFMDAYDATGCRGFLDAVASTLHCASNETADLNRLLVLTFSHVASRASQLSLADDDLVAGVFDFVIIGGTSAPWLFGRAACFEFFFAFAIEALSLGCANPSLFRFFQASWQWAHLAAASSSSNKAIIHPPTSFHHDVWSYVVPRMPSFFQRLFAATTRLGPTAFLDDTMDAVAETFLYAGRAFEPVQLELWTTQVLTSDAAFPKPGVAITVKNEFVELMRQPHVATARKLRRLLKQLCRN